MPRKQNGFGNPKSFGFKQIGGADKGYKSGAAGRYPSNRRFGSSVQRTVIEQYDLDSDWVRWRKGFEYYSQAAWYRLEDYNIETDTYDVSKINSKIYQGTEFEIDVTFDGYKFATQNADSNNHYVMKRNVISDVDIGVVTRVENDRLDYPDQKLRGEIYTQLNAGEDIGLLPLLEGERLTDGTTEATFIYALTSDKTPVNYKGKPRELSECRVKFNPRLILGDGVPSNPQDLIGKIVYLREFYTNKPITEFDKFDFIDDAKTFTVETQDQISTSMDIYDPGDTQLPPALYDFTELQPILVSNSTVATLTTNQVFNKDRYQRFFGAQYLTADLVKSKVNQAAYSLLPFRIIGVSAGIAEWELFGTPLAVELTLQDTPSAYAVFSDFSFTKTSIDTYDGSYYHKQGAPGDELWKRVDTDVDPWMDEIFSSGNTLELATVYTCSCPNHSKAQLRMPQASQDENTRKVNRQKRYPLPSVMSPNEYDLQGIATAAGQVDSWETRRDKARFKMCKHSIAAMFIEKIKIQEPNSYPSVETRLKFEEKLAKDIAEVADEFRASYRRGGITTLEIVFALAKGLNLDDTELAYVLLNSNF